MLFLKKLSKLFLLISLPFITFSTFAQEAIDQVESDTTETLILQQDDETATNEADGKWDFIEHEENESDITEYEEGYSDNSIQVHGYDALTIYIDASWGYRTEKAAINLTESHKEYATQGYQFVDLELYLEDSDLKGFFVTYERSSN